MSELFLLMKQGEQGWLLSAGGGNHEYARLFWCDSDGKGPRYRVGMGGDPKLGRFALLGADLDEKGAALTWSDGRRSFIPSSWYQVTYVI